MSDLRGAGSRASQRSDDRVLNLLAPLTQTKEERLAGIWPYFATNGNRVVFNARENELYQMFTQRGETGPLEEHQAMREKVITTLQSSPIDKVEPFQYEALPTPSSIRLLEIIPPAQNSVMQLSMKTHDFDHSMPKYECLSYTWGNPHASLIGFDFYAQNDEDHGPSKLWPVICNGKLLYIRRNLYDALRNMPEKRFADVLAAISESQAIDYITQVSLVEKILYDRDSPQAKSGMNALSVAASKGYMEFCRQNIRMGHDDPFEKDTNGSSAIDQAVQHGHSALSTLMIDEYNKSKVAASRKPIWIDAICINQQDLSERSSQVQTMGKIYSHAACVNVWLGAADSLTVHISTALAKLTPAVENGRLVRSKIIPFGPFDQLRAFTDAGMRNLTTNEWLALAAIYQRQYFRRVWTLQEAVLAGSVFAFVGKEEIPWDLLLLLAHMLRHLTRISGRFISSFFLPDALTEIEAPADFVWECRQRHVLEHMTAAQREQWFRNSGGMSNKRNAEAGRLSLFEMVRRTETLDCFDPRDRVYGVMGMTSDGPGLTQVLVDYAKPTSQLWTEVTRHYIDNSKEPNSNVLGQLFGRIRDTTLTKLDGLPSWVPDYSFVGSFSLSANSFKADGGTQHTTSVNEDWKQLTVRGVKIATTNRVARARNKDPINTNFDLDPSWFDLVLGMPLTNLHGQPRTEVLWRTLCADHPDDHMSTDQESASRAPPEYGKQFRDLVCAMILRARHLKAEQDESSAVETPSNMQSLSTTFMTSSPAQKQEECPAVAPERTFSLATMTEAIANTSNDADRALGLLKKLEQDESHDTPTADEIAAHARDPTYLIEENQRSPSRAKTVRMLKDRHSGFINRFAAIYGNRRLYVTQSGHLGLGPGSLEIGDEVWAIAGAKVPVILRRKNAEPNGQQVYRLLGETYVHGFMHGEAVVDSGREFESIILE